MTKDLKNNYKEPIEKATKEYSDMIQSKSASVNENYIKLHNEIERNIKKEKEKSKEFWKFEKTKEIIFWIGCVSNFLGVGLLIYFLYFAKR